MDDPRPAILAGLTVDPPEYDALLELDRLTAGGVSGEHDRGRRPFESLILAAFEYASDSRFNPPVPGHGAWYAALQLATAVYEVAHHFKARAIDEGLLDAPHSTGYAVFESDVQDVLYDAMQDPDYLAGLRQNHNEYADSQRLGEHVRADGRAGIHYHSVRSPQAGQGCVALLQSWAVRNVRRGGRVYLTWDPARRAAIATLDPPDLSSAPR